MGVVYEPPMCILWTLAVIVGPWKQRLAQFTAVMSRKFERVGSRAHDWV